MCEYNPHLNDIKFPKTYVLMCKNQCWLTHLTVPFICILSLWNAVLVLCSLSKAYITFLFSFVCHWLNQDVLSRTGTRGTFERWEGTIQVAAVDAKHQSFICFEATSNQFHPSRFQANHVAEGRQCAKSVWIEEKTDRHRGKQTPSHTDR